MSNDYDTFDVAASAIGWVIAFLAVVIFLNAVLGYILGGL